MMNKRIDDLRNQMQREHDSLAKRLDDLESKFDILLKRLNGGHDEMAIEQIMKDNQDADRNSR